MCDLCNERSATLRQFGRFIIVFNKYPYLPGHIMIVTEDHIGNSWTNLSIKDAEKLGKIIRWCEKILKRGFCTDSLNMGQNIGPISGASIDEHFHIHLVPRLKNDHGFFNIFAGLPPRKYLEKVKSVEQLLRTAKF